MCEVYPANIVRLSNAVLGQTIGENNQAGRQPFSLKQNLVSIFCPSDSSRISLRPIFQRFQRPVPASFLGLVIPSTSHSDNFRLGESILISMVPWSNRRWLKPHAAPKWQDLNLWDPRPFLFGIEILRNFNLLQALISLETSAASFWEAERSVRQISIHHTNESHSMFDLPISPMPWRKQRAFSRSKANADCVAKSKSTALKNGAANSDRIWWLTERKSNGPARGTKKPVTPCGACVPTWSGWIHVTYPYPSLSDSTNSYMRTRSSAGKSKKGKVFDLCLRDAARTVNFWPLPQALVYSW